MSSIAFPPTFVDLFAGIGGIRLAFERAGAHCVFSSEYNPAAGRTYHANFGVWPAGDITQISASEIPDFDILTAGFPCQPFSIAGVAKYNALGHSHGFHHATQGTLFFDIARILASKRPAAFFLENVRHLLHHDSGRTFSIIHRTLVEELGYFVHYQVLDASGLVPQHRKRVYIVGFRESLAFEFPTLPDLHPRLGDILESEVAPRYTLSDHLWTYLQNYAAKHDLRGNGFGFGLVTPDSITRTLSARYHKDGSEILLSQPGRNPRRLTPRECARLMGFPESFRIVTGDSTAYRLFGNSVVVPVVEHIARAIMETLRTWQVASPAPYQPALFDEPLFTQYAPEVSQGSHPAREAIRPGKPSG